MLSNSHIWLLASVLLLAVSACNKTPPTSSKTASLSPTATATYSSEGYTAQLVESIENADPPLYPNPSPGCIWDIPEDVFRSYERRYAEWVSEQIINGNLTELTNLLDKHASASKINIIPSEEGLFLVTIARLECYSAANYTPGATVYIMDQAGNISHVIDRIGQPYPRFTERAHWDGMRWSLLSHQVDVYWGATSAKFTVWHIFAENGEWRSEQFELEDAPILNRSLEGGLVFGRFEDGTMIGLTYGNSSCDSTHAEQKSSPNLSQYRFDGTIYKKVAIGHDHNGQFVACHQYE